MLKINKGFTLVELISVISLLLILSVLAVAAYGNISEAARRAAVQADANAVARALNAYNSIVNDGGYLGVLPAFFGDGDVFTLVVEEGVNGPVSVDLSVVVGPGRGGDVVAVLGWQEAAGGHGIWVVNSGFAAGLPPIAGI